MIIGHLVVKCNILNFENDVVMNSYSLPDGNNERVASLNMITI